MTRNNRGGEIGSNTHTNHLVSKTNDGLKYQGRHILDQVEILAAAGHALLSNGKFDALRSLSDELYENYT